jgi:hypothetical protein
VDSYDSRDIMEWIVQHPISRNMALDSTFGRYGTRICEKVWCGGAGGCVFATEISPSGDGCGRGLYDSENDSLIKN